MSTVKLIYSVLLLVKHSLSFQATPYNPKASLHIPIKEPARIFYIRAINSDQEIELYHDNGKEIDNVQIDAEDPSNENTKKLIECHASVLLPFSADVAFDAFSDLTRQPSWCKYLKSVEYIGFSDNEKAADSKKMHLRESKWTVSVKGLSFR